ncbi:gamma-glutamyltranspeptidase [Clavulina sp. PMI_390]|nr:gamma-glutamyltranspeptidase [Clavulina sp. PMI_390]
MDPFLYPSRRSTVYSTKGIVSSSQPLASEAGLEILRLGGNAVDAAVATIAALNVTEPSCCGIGGDAFCLFYDAKSKSVKGLNGSGRSPAALTIEHARKTGVTGSEIPRTNLNSVTVPGAAAAWYDSVKEWGSGNVNFEQVMAPAIRLAEQGVPTTEINSLAWQNSEGLIKSASPNAASMLYQGRAPKPGEVMRFPDLANTFRLLVELGKPGFYTGPVAESIVELVNSKSGVMSLEDLAAHDTDFITPITYTYHGVTLHECPPNGQGLTALIALGLLTALEERKVIRPPVEMVHNSVEYLHLLIEVLRLAFADAQYYVADPKVQPVPVDKLLAREYLLERSKLFDPTKASPWVENGSPLHSSDTVQFAVTDKWGNGCSFICSNYAGFGTAAIPKGCGFTLQNRGSGFRLTEGHPNQLAPNKRPYHTIIPAIATKGDELWLTFGCMGGFMQPQGHLQILLSMMRGFSPQAAVDAARFCISAGLPDAEVGGSTAGNINSTVYFEDTLDPNMGHRVLTLKGTQRAMMGRAQVIERVVSGDDVVWGAGSDPRADGHAAAEI